MREKERVGESERAKEAVVTSIKDAPNLSTAKLEAVEVRVSERE